MDGRLDKVDGKLHRPDPRCTGNQDFLSQGYANHQPANAEVPPDNAGCHPITNSGSANSATLLGQGASPGNLRGAPAQHQGQQLVSMKGSNSFLLDSIKGSMSAS